MLDLIGGILVGAVVGLVLGAIVGARALARRRAGRAAHERERALRLRADVEQELKDKRLEAAKIEERAVAKEQEAERKLVELERREQGFSDRETHVKQLQDDLKAAKEAELKE